jgi:hypothetical protein
MTRRWSIPSNAGSDTIVFEHVGADIWRVLAATTHTDRTHAGDAPCNEVVEHELRICQLVVERAKLVDLAAAFRRWLGDFQPFVFVLTAAPGQRVTLKLGADPRLISSSTKPALFLEYRGIAVEVQAFTVLDETCVRIAAEGLEAALQ